MNLPSRTAFNVPQHIKLQDSYPSGKNRPLNKKGGHHIQTLVYDSVKANTQSSEDVRRKIKEGLQSIYFTLRESGGVKSSPQSNKKGCESLAQAIYYNEKNEEIIVRFVGRERFLMSPSNLEKFNLSPSFSSASGNLSEIKVIKPRPYLDFTNRESLYNQILEIKKNKDLDSLYFISEVKEPSKKSFLHYIGLSSHRQALQFITSKNKEKQITSSEIEESLLNSLDKGVAKEYSEDFPYKFKVKLEISLPRNPCHSFSSPKGKEHRITSKAYEITSSGYKFILIKKRKKEKILKKSGSILFYFPLSKNGKKYMLTSPFIPIFKLIKSINFTKKQMENIRLLPMEGKVNIKVQRSLKSQLSCIRSLEK